MSEAGANDSSEAEKPDSDQNLTPYGQAFGGVFAVLRS
jgi:hypothetical protein